MKNTLLRISTYFILFSGFSFGIEYYVNTDKSLLYILFKSLITGFVISLFVGIYVQKAKKKRKKVRKNFEL